MRLVSHRVELWGSCSAAGTVVSASGPATSRPGWLLPLVIAVVALAVSGGIATRGLYRQADSTGALLTRQDQMRGDTQPPGSPRANLTADAATAERDGRVFPVGITGRPRP